LWLFEQALWVFFGGGLDVEVVAGDEGFFLQGLADAGGGFGIGGGGEGSAEELEGIEVVGALFEFYGWWWWRRVEIGVDDGGEGGFALFFGFGEAVFEDGREWAEVGVVEVVDDGAEVRGRALFVVRCALFVLAGTGNGRRRTVGARPGVGWKVESGELEGVEEAVGAADVDFCAADGAHDHADAGLDGGAVFGQGEKEFGEGGAGELDFGVGGGQWRVRPRRGAVVVAEGAVAAEGGGTATVAIVEDVAAGEAFGSGGLGAGCGLRVHDASWCAARLWVKYETPAVGPGRKGNLTRIGADEAPIFSLI